MSSTKESLNILSMVKLGLILALYSAVACVGLAFVYTGTKDIIDLNREADRYQALQIVFPTAENFNPVSGISSSDPVITIEDSYAAMRSGEIIGIAIQASRFSYSGPIVVLVGVGIDGRISGIQILENTDTPGLGSNAHSPNYFIDRANGIRFYEQFSGKEVSDPFIPKQDVVAIAAATITSRAVASSVKVAGEAGMAWFAGQQGGRR